MWIYQLVKKSKVSIISLVFPMQKLTSRFWESDSLKEVGLLGVSSSSMTMGGTLRTLTGLVVVIQSARGLKFALRRKESEAAICHFLIGFPGEGNFG